MDDIFCRATDLFANEINIILKAFFKDQLIGFFYLKTKSWKFQTWMHPRIIYFGVGQPGK